MTRKSVHIRPHRTRASYVPVEEHKRYLVVHNGEKTEQGLLTLLKGDLPNGVLTIKFQKGDVYALVKKARELSNKSQGDQFDRVYIVSDVDNSSRKQLERYFAMCEAEGYELILSNPCIEVWAQCYTGCVTGKSASIKGAQKEAERSGVVVGKKINPKMTKDHILAAKTAKKLRKTYGDDIKTCRPTTDVDRIIDSVSDELSR